MGDIRKRKTRIELHRLKERKACIDLHEPRERNKCIEYDRCTYQSCRDLEAVYFSFLLPFIGADLALSSDVGVCKMSRLGMKKHLVAALRAAS